MRCQCPPLPIHSKTGDACSMPILAAFVRPVPQGAANLPSKTRLPHLMSMHARAVRPVAYGLGTESCINAFTQPQNSSETGLRNANRTRDAQRSVNQGTRTGLIPAGWRTGWAAEVDDRDSCLAAPSGCCRPASVPLASSGRCRPASMLAATSIPGKRRTSANAGCWRRQRKAARPCRRTAQTAAKAGEAASAG